MSKALSMTKLPGAYCLTLWRVVFWLAWRPLPVFAVSMTAPRQRWAPKANGLTAYCFTALQADEVKGIDDKET